ncbi:hypothetical protein BH09BAC3_BH09BAC3_12800 [soil metagenome]
MRFYADWQLIRPKQLNEISDFDGMVMVPYSKTQIYYGYDN